MKRYQIICPSCSGNGYVSCTNLASSSATNVCKACNGCGTVICEEE